jgi:hypothetical protein
MNPIACLLSILIATQTVLGWHFLASEYSDIQQSCSQFNVPAACEGFGHIACRWDDDRVCEIGNPASIVINAKKRCPMFKSRDSCLRDPKAMLHGFNLCSWDDNRCEGRIWD